MQSTKRSLSWWSKDATTVSRRPSYCNNLLFRSPQWSKLSLKHSLTWRMYLESTNVLGTMYCGFYLSRIRLYFPMSVRVSLCHRRDNSVLHLYITSQLINLVLVNKRCIFSWPQNTLVLAITCRLPVVHGSCFISSGSFQATLPPFSPHSTPPQQCPSSPPRQPCSRSQSSPFPFSMLWGLPMDKNNIIFIDIYIVEHR